MGKILLVNVNLIKENQIRKVCGILGHKVVSVSKNDIHLSLGHLAGIKGAPINGEKSSKSEITAEMMIFSAIDSDSLDVFLAQYRNAKIAPVDRKAVITPTNYFWSLGKLCEELDREILSQMLAGMK